MRQGGSLAAWWFARIAVAAVFFVNVQSALQLILRPERHTASFELAGAGAVTAVQAVGLLFLMWNATYPLVVVDPAKHRTLFAVVLAQQSIAVAGELWLAARLPETAGALSGSIARFHAFDAVGLVLMAAAYTLLRASDPR